MTDNSVFFFVAPQTYEAKAAGKNLTAETLPVLARAGASLEGLADWTAAGVHAALTRLGEELGLALGKIAQPLRVAIAGGAVSPPIDQTLSILGRAEVLRRIAAAEAFIRSSRG
jgi:glutamyl-tRNA synthetase